MTPSAVKTELKELIDELPDDETHAARRYLEFLVRRRSEHFRKIDPRSRPDDLLHEIGIWEDSRSTEEIIDDIYSHRTVSETTIDL